MLRRWGAARTIAPGISASFKSSAVVKQVAAYIGKGVLVLNPSLACCATLRLTINFRHHNEREEIFFFFCLCLFCLCATRCSLFFLIIICSMQNLHIKWYGRSIGSLLSTTCAVWAQHDWLILYPSPLSLFLFKKVFYYTYCTNTQKLK